MTKFTEWISTKYNSVNLEKIPSIPSKPSPAFLLKIPLIPSKFFPPSPFRVSFVIPVANNFLP